MQKRAHLYCWKPSKPYKQREYGVIILGGNSGPSQTNASMSSPEKDTLLCETKPRGTERAPGPVATEREQVLFRLVIVSSLKGAMGAAQARNGITEIKRKKPKLMLTYGQPGLRAACNAETQPGQWHRGPWWQPSQHKARGT